MTTSPYLETLGVLLLAVLGVLLGRRAVRARPLVWALAYLIPLALLIMIAVARWMPGLEFTVPFCWIMADRREFALLALIATLMLTPLVPKLRHRGERVLVVVLMVLVVTVYSALPFLMPAFNRSHFLHLDTRLAEGGVCLQSTDYDCGPAAAVTALRRLGLPAEEGELAILAHTTGIAGTPADSLCAAIDRRFHGDGIRCTFRRFKSVAELRGQEPVIAVIKFGFLVDHYITVLEVTDTSVLVGDPLSGLQTLTHRQLADEWRQCGIVVRRESQQTPITK